MAYFKYIPYLFLLVTAIFIYDAIARYTEGRDFIPSILLALGALAMFFIRRRSYRRYTGHNNPPKK